jgi:hypothetical protein
MSILARRFEASFRQELSIINRPEGCTEGDALILSESRKDEYGLHGSEKHDILSELQGNTASHLGPGSIGADSKGMTERSPSV